MNDSLELQQQLQSRATSLEEGQALVNEELKAQKAEHAQSLRQAIIAAGVAAPVAALSSQAPVRLVISSASLYVTSQLGLVMVKLTCTDLTSPVCQ